MIRIDRARLVLRAGAGIAFAVLVTGCAAGGGDGNEPAPAPQASAALEASVPVAAPRAPLQPDETLLRAATAKPEADEADEANEKVIAVPGSPATRDSLPELLASAGTAEFESHLAGPWYRLVQPDPSDSLTSRMEIIHFEPEQRRVTLFDGDVQEIYVWDVSHRLLAARLGIWVHNELVPSIERTINVEAVAADEIRVVMKGDDDHYFDGNYRKLGDAARTRLADSGRVRPGLVELDLAGRYRDGTGQAIDFEPPHFTWQTADERVSGTYTAYSLGQPVIVFKVMSPAGVTRELRTFTVDYRERRHGEQLLRSLVLRPARLAITGVTGVGAAALHFEQLETLDAAITEDTNAAAAARAIVITPSPGNER